ncbi:choice-of-anchor I domain-containing protein [Synechococcus sp. BS55D]|uniref:choice-of-anchor I domain-containing protein n=1 Tax=Synechococcus sp. BS55D TaxID=2055943 RepID=UPI00103D3CA0
MAFSLQILYASDLEGGSIGALDAAVNFAAIVDALDDGSIPTLVLSAGDNMIPGPFYNAGGDRAALRDSGVLNNAYNTLLSTTDYDSLRELPGVVDVAIMNAIGFDASALGNHEFDAGTSALADLVKQDSRGAAGPAGDRYVGTLFPYLSANLDVSADSGLNALYQSGIVDGTAGAAARKLAAAASFTLDGGEKVAVIGATTPILSTISSPGAVVAEGGGGLSTYPVNDAERAKVVAALATELQTSIDAAIAAGANKVILVSHLQQVEMEKDLIRALSGVDVMVAGGSEASTFDNGSTSSTDDDIFITTNKDGTTAYVVSVPGQYEMVGRIQLSFNDSGVPSLIKADGIPATAAGVSSVGGDATTGTAAIVQNLVNAVTGVVTSKDQQIYGYTDVYLQGNRGFIRTEETNFGNLAADSQLWKARTIDPTIQVSLKNGGGLRAAIGDIGGTAAAPELVAPLAKSLAKDGYDKPAGAISQLDIENSLRFNNTLVTVETDAAGLRALMEHAISASSAGNTPGQFPQIAGMRFEFNHAVDYSSEAGQQRIKTLVIVDENDAVTDVIVENGQLVGNPDRTIKMVTLNFLANNDGDSYPFSTVSRSITDITESGTKVSEQTALAQYLQAFYPSADKAFKAAETSVDDDKRIINSGLGNSNQIIPLPSTMATASIDLGGAEIVSYAADHKVALVITGGDQLAVVNLSNPSSPKLVKSYSLDGDAQSVTVHGDLAAVAIAGKESQEDAGLVVFYKLSGSGSSTKIRNIGNVVVGTLPDSLSFNADGTKIVVANEAEPNQWFETEDSIDRPGTISVIDVNRSNPGNSVVTNLGFDAAQTAYLKAREVRISTGDASTDIEPEYVTISGDTAYVSLQENNALAVVNIAGDDPSAYSISDIRSLGIKDWDRGLASAKDVSFSIDFAPGTNVIADSNYPSDKIVAGGLSGLWYDESTKLYYTISDRGPQAQDVPVKDGIPKAYQGEKVFNAPEFSPTVYTLSGDANGVTATGQIALQVPYLDGSTVKWRNLTGIGQLFTVDSTSGAESVSGPDDAGFKPDGNGGYTPIAADAFGMDTESIIRLTVPGLNGGNPVFAISDEYRPQIGIFDASSGKLVHRIVPSDTDYSSVSYDTGRGDVSSYTLKTLPSVYSDRRANRGFEGLAYNSKDGLLYAFIQSPMRPSGYDKDSLLRRIVAVDPTTGEAKKEFLYIQAGASNQDKIGDAVYDAERDTFYVLDRDSGTSIDSNKSILEFDLANATNVLGFDWSAKLGVSQPEQLDAVSLSTKLAAAGIAQVQQTDLFNLPSIGASAKFDKPEGLAIGPDGDLVVGYDNDFLSASGRPDNQLSFISFQQLAVDTSDKDGGFLPGDRSFYGVRMADTIASFSTEGKTYVVSANEGDGRVRPDDVNFEAPADGIYSVGTNKAKGAIESFADPLTGETLYVYAGAGIGTSLDFEAEEGDEFFITKKYGAGADDEFYSDEKRAGKLKQPSANTIVAAKGEGRLKTIVDLNTDKRLYGFGGRSFTIYDGKGNVVFDSGNELEQKAFELGILNDSRSDDKGTEPEGVTTAVINGRTYVFVGLERGTSSAILQYDVTDPYNAYYVNALVNENSISPEGLEYVSTGSNGGGFLMAANEVSGTLDIFEFANKTYADASDPSPISSFDASIFGNAVADTITGTNGADFISGLAGNDVINGGDGSDDINGNAGDDTLTGGGGADVFRLSKGSDTITDFNIAAGDRVAIVSGQTYSLNQSGSDLQIIREGFGTTTLKNISSADFGDNQIVFI